MQDTKIALQVCQQYDNDIIRKALNNGFNLLGGLSSFIKPSDIVLIKPDLYCGTEPNLAKTTHPSVVSAVAELVSKIGAKCIIADSPKGDFKTSKLDNVYIKTQMLQASNNGNAQLNINDDVATVNNPKGEFSRDIYVMDAIRSATVIINVGKLRCDKYLGLVGCCQNLFGLVPGKMKDLITSRCYTTNAYSNYIIDLYEALEDKIVLNILDAIVSREANNDPRILNCLIIGSNPFSVDATALQLINQDPKDNILLQQSERRKKFSFNFEQLGDSIEPLICCDYNYIVAGDNIKKGNTRSFKSKYNRQQKRPIISNKTCKGCKVCLEGCPMRAIEMKYGGLGQFAHIDYSKCINCLKCVTNCPYKVIQTKTPIKYKPIDKMLKKSSKTKD